MNDPNTYIEKDVIKAWGVQMTQLNNDAIDIMNSIQQEVKTLNESWKGHAADGFTKVTNDLVTEGINCHNKMKNVEKMLMEVVITAENQ